MKVLIVNKFLHHNGGSETYIFQIGRELKKQGHNVQYFGMNHPERCVGNEIDCYTSTMDFHSGKLEKLLYPFKIIYSREAYQKMLKLLDQFRPDVVHLNNFNYQLTPSILYAIKKYKHNLNSKTKIVFTAHDYQLICPNHLLCLPETGNYCNQCVKGRFFSCISNKCIHNTAMRSILGAVESCLYRILKTYKMLDTIICPSRFMREQLSHSKILAPKCIVMYNYIQEKAASSVKELGNYVLYFGRYSKEKGIATLIKVCKDLKDIPFVFAGNGPMEDEVSSCGNIKNVGFLNGQELIDVIKKARFVVFPSECFENCPFSVMEAQLYQTPVLGAAIGGAPELIKNQVTGELFQSGNYEDLKQKIMKLWNDEDRCRTYAANCAEISFDTLEEYVVKLIELYKTAGERTRK